MFYSLMCGLFVLVCLNGKHLTDDTVTVCIEMFNVVNFVANHVFFFKPETENSRCLRSLEFSKMNTSNSHPLTNLVYYLLIFDATLFFCIHWSDMLLSAGLSLSISMKIDIIFTSSWKITGYTCLYCTTLSPSFVVMCSIDLLTLKRGVSVILNDLKPTPTQTGYY